MHNIVRELVAYIFGTLGFVENKKFELGLICQQCLSVKKIITEENGNEISYPIWMGKAAEHTVVFSNIGTVNYPECVAILDSLYIFKLDNESASIMRKLEDRWIPASMSEQLSVTLFFELIMQEGHLWMPINDGQIIDCLYNELIAVIEQMDAQGEKTA